MTNHSLIVKTCFTKFVCWHRRYNLGNVKDFDTPDDFLEYEKENKLIKLPLYMYDHSGISIHADSRPYPYNDRFDSGQLGYVYCTLDQVRKEFGCKHVSKQIRQKAVDLMLAEVGTYDSILRGEVYGYVIENEETGEELDSCWGFIGDYKYCLGEAKSLVDYHIEHAKKEETELISRAMSYA